VTTPLLAVAGLVAVLGRRWKSGSRRRAVPRRRRLLTVALGARLAAEARPSVLPGIFWWGSPLRGEAWRRWLHPGIVTAIGSRAAELQFRPGGRRRSGRRVRCLSPGVLRDEFGERTP
jgi:hypothetical protein